MSVTVIVGLIGAGKTTLASRMPGDHVSFDREWHEVVQAQGGTPKDLVAHMARVLHEYDDAVIDGWWTWRFEWFKQPEDGTLVTLRKLIKRPIRLIYLKLTDEQAHEQYMKKFREGRYQGTRLGFRTMYLRPIRQRQDCMDRRVACC